MFTRFRAKRDQRKLAKLLGRLDRLQHAAKLTRQQRRAIFRSAANEADMLSDLVLIAHRKTREAAQKRVGV